MVPWPHPSHNGLKASSTMHWSSRLTSYNTQSSWGIIHHTMVLRPHPPHSGLKASSTTQWSFRLITLVLTSLPRCDSAIDKPPRFSGESSCFVICCITSMLWCNKWHSKMTHHWRHRHVVTQRITMKDDSPMTSLAGPHNKWQSNMTHH